MPIFIKNPRSPIKLQSAKGYIACLESKNQLMQTVGLERLNEIIDVFWPEISEAVPKIEEFHHDKSFPKRGLAALLASKVYFHLGAYNEAIDMALAAGEHFDVSSESLYAQTIISKALDMYVCIQKWNFETKDEHQRKTLDPRLTALVERMFSNCIEIGKYREAVGFAFESHRIDLLQQLLEATKPEEKSSLLAYCVKSALNFVHNKSYRRDILSCVVKVYEASDKPDYINVCQCLIYLEDPERVAKILHELIQRSKKQALQAYQIAFDLYESATQQYIVNILKFLNDYTQVSPMECNESVSQASTSADTHALNESKLQMDSLKKILSGDESTFLHMQFLIKNNKTDMLVLRGIKDVVRTNITHNATVIANALMHAGTTCDDFLRDNLEWVGKASNWAKFTAVASLGVIHHRHENEAMKVLESYLPKDNQISAGSAGYLEGGGFYALGLIHANHGNDKVVDYLMKQMVNTNSNVKHGVCLGLGLTAMGTHKEEVYKALKNCLDTDDAVIGEAAGLAMGLVMLGSKSSDAAQDMTSYAAETQHEKTLRGLCVGLSLLNLGRLEEADTLIATLTGDKDPNIRRSAVYTLAMAYCGTKSSQAVRTLLNISVSDVNDDVRRAAVTCLGFVLCKSPESCPSIVASLAESFNPHVRYGAAMALGIACAGTANKEAISLLDPLLNDATSIVRQGALIAMAMLLMQHNEVTSSKVKDFRATLSKIVGDKQEDNMTKLGCIIAQGILDAAGRNATISLTTRSGHLQCGAIVGMLVFLQYWFWFPLAHFIALAFRPTCLICVNGDLQMPKVEILSSVKPSTFAYPPPLEEKKDKPTEKVETAVLSITAKQKKKEKEKQSRVSVDEKMEVDDPKIGVTDTTSLAKQEPGQTKGQEKATSNPITNVSTKATPSSDAEPNSQILTNPTRVLNSQLRYITLSSSRYEPLKDVTSGGIVMLDDKESDKPSDLVEMSKGGGVKPAEDEKMADPPEPFEFID